MKVLSTAMGDMAEIGVSVPIEPIASWPVVAMGDISNLMSDRISFFQIKGFAFGLNVASLSV